MPKLDQGPSSLKGFFCLLSGEDHSLIQDCEDEPIVAGNFSLIGFLAMVIFVLSVYSSTSFLANVVNGNSVIAFAIGIFWGFIVSTIYYLLLFTLTPPMLKGKDRAVKGSHQPILTEEQQKTLSRISLAFRVFFVTLIAVVIAQPLLADLFNVTSLLDQYRESYQRDLMKLADDPLTQNHIQQILATNSFYTRRIQLVNSHFPMAWLATLIVVFLFILPMILKYRIRNKSGFYTKKKKFEQNIVKDAYTEFKANYSNIFFKQYGIEVAYYESCDDPPFNTCKKTSSTNYRTQQDLLSHIYGDDEDSDNQKQLVSEKIS